MSIDLTVTGVAGGLQNVFAVDSEAHSTTYAVAYDVASFIDRSFDEAMPYQYLREFTDNSIAAQASLIVIEPDWIYVESCVAQGIAPVYRWSIWDNGVGMGEEMLMRFHRVFDSTKGNMRSRHSNFGMGAKIAGLPINPNGMIVMSWQNGEGNMIVFHRDEIADQYGLYRQHVEAEDGSILRLEVAPTPPEYDYYYNPETGKREKRVSGTLVIFTGTSDTDHTYLGPTNREWPSVRRTIRTNTLELNKRFAELNRPDLSVFIYGPAHKDEVLWAHCRADASGKATKGHPLFNPKKAAKDQPRFGQYRKVQGAFVSWNADCSHQGTLNITGGKIHWWLFDSVDPKEYTAKDVYRQAHGLQKAGNLTLDEKGFFDTYARTWDRHSYTPEAGMLAVLYKGELYNHRAIRDSGCHHLFNYFGIYDKDVRKRIVIVVEPDYTEDSGVWPNSVRSALEFEDQDKLPWDLWGMEFSANMPPEIKTILDSGGGQFRDSADFHDRITNLVKEIGSRYGLYTGPRKTIKPPTPTPTPTGTGTTTCTTTPPGTQTTPPGTQTTPPGTQTTPPPKPGPRRVVRKRKPTVATGGSAMPSFAIIDAKKSPEAPRPAFYNGTARRLDIFASYHIFQSAVQYWQDVFSHKPGAEQIVEDTVLEVYTAMLVARVTHVLGLKGQDIYDVKAFEMMLSQEAFVTSVAGFFDADMWIKAKLNGKLGSHKKNPSVDTGWVSAPEDAIN